MVRLVSDLSNEHQVRLISGICLMPKRGDELLIDGQDFDQSAGFWSICRILIDRMTPQVPGYGSLPCNLGYFTASNWASALPSNTVWEDAYPWEIYIFLWSSGFPGAPSHQLPLVGCPTMGNARPSYFPFWVPIPTTCDPYCIYPLLYVPINSQCIWFAKCAIQKNGNKN